MDELIQDILVAIKKKGPLTASALDRIIQQHNRKNPATHRRYAKKHLWPYYLHVKQTNQTQWQVWDVDRSLEQALRETCQMKPRRTASGVATVTVLTKPWPCTSNCLFCPCDVRMPKSYLHDEPACQRAERNYFDPFLQVSSRLHVLHDMGHAIDKVELIVLGATFTDYSRGYQIWFMSELFRALNTFEPDDDLNSTDSPTSTDNSSSSRSSDNPEGAVNKREREERKRRATYQDAGIACDPTVRANQVQDIQTRVSAGKISFNEAIETLYGSESPWASITPWQTGSLEQLVSEQDANEQARCRCVGLVVETRPDAITTESLTLLRQLGCTKIQLGIQSLDNQVLTCCRRKTLPQGMGSAFELLRAFGFKSHAHFMVNLPGQTPEADKQDYLEFVGSPLYKPDEIKLYPCALIESTALYRQVAQADNQDGEQTTAQEAPWTPYPESVLVDILACDVLATPEYTRISRMIRDFSAHDIVAGNKKANLRQMVEREVERRRTQTGSVVREMRLREITTHEIDLDSLQLKTLVYDTSNTEEQFLQWVTPEGRLAGFLRLSLPLQNYIQNTPGLPIKPAEAMIREVHIYGAAAHLGRSDSNTQHAGLGRMLIEKACRLSKEAGYEHINVISAVGTRAYYRSLGFEDCGLYQQRTL